MMRRCAILVKLQAQNDIRGGRISFEHVQIGTRRILHENFEVTWESTTSQASCTA